MQKEVIKKIMIVGLSILLIEVSISPGINGQNQKSCNSSKKVEINQRCDQTFLQDPPMVDWEKTYGGFLDDNAFSVQQTTDGGYILTGSHNYDPYNMASGDLWLIKTDANGNEQWNTSYGGVYLDYGFSVKQTTDGGFIISGCTQEPSGYYNLYLVKTNTNGVAEWIKTYGLAGTDEIGYDVMQETDGGYLIIGGHGYEQGLWLIKTDSYGTIAWDKTILIGIETCGYQILKSNEDSYVILGYSRPDVLTYDTLLLKTDLYGNIQWFRTYSAAQNYYLGESIDQTTDGGYVIVGITTDLGEYDIMFFKTDANGTQEWKQIFHGYNYSRGFYTEETRDGGFIITGVSDYERLLVLKTDTNGNQQWVQYFGEYICGFEVHQTTDQGYIIIGTTYTDDAMHDFYLVKLASENSENHPPDTPSIIGPTTGNIKVKTTYNFTTTDPEGDNVSYYIEWGDGTTSGWRGPYLSSEILVQTHTWTKKGKYTIRAKAKDVFGNESDWGQLTVAMPYSSNLPFQQFWQRFFEQYPLAFPLLRQLMGY